MENLFSPWRYAYLTQDKREEGCPFCKVQRGADERANLVVYRARHNFVILNLYPYNSGHLMIVPKEHVASPAASSELQRAEMAELTVACEQVLRETYRPDAMNLGMNLGRAGGAGIEDHYHLHVVPRWSGDTNFMTVTAGTRVIPEDLRVSRDRVRAAFVARLGPDGEEPSPGEGPPVSAGA